MQPQAIRIVPFTDEELREAVAVRKQFQSTTEAARSLGLSKDSMRRRLNKAASLGLLGPQEALPGYMLKSISSQAPDGSWIKQTKAPGDAFEVPVNHSIKGISALVDGDGNTVQQWIKTTNTPSLELTLEAIRQAAENFPAREETIPCPPASSSDLLTLYPLADWHIGMFSWGRETGTDWDLQIAEKTITRALMQVVSSSPRAAHAIILGGGDLLHADSSANATAKSGNVLDVDGRYQKVIETACRLLVRQADAALAHHRTVTLRILQGNHDEHASVAVAYFLQAYYRNDTRITIDTSPSPFFWHQFDKVMIGATHGHLAKPSDMPGIMAHRQAEAWGSSKFRYAHCFHVHHKSLRATEGGGCIVETHQAPIPQDAWHYGSGFLSGRSMKSITYHKDFGEIARSTTAIIDSQEAKAHA